jgi:hypothetical protein
MQAEKIAEWIVTHQGRLICFTNAFASCWKNWLGKKGSWISPGVMASLGAALYGWRV